MSLGAPAILQFRKKIPEGEHFFSHYLTLLKVYSVNPAYWRNHTGASWVQVSRPKQQCPCCLCPVALYVLLTQPTPITCMALMRFATGRQPRLQPVLYADSAYLSASEHYKFNCICAHLFACIGLLPSLGKFTVRLSSAVFLTSLILTSL